MKYYSHRYYGFLFKFTLNEFKTGDIIHIYLTSNGIEDFKLKLKLTGIEFELKDGEN